MSWLRHSKSIQIAPRGWAALALALPLWASTAAAEPTSGAAARATARLTGLLREEAQRAGKELVTGEEQGALGTTVVRVAIRDAYPGSGVARVVLWKGRSYGVRGEHDLAELVRERGWLKHAPETAGFVRLVGDAQFDGLLAVDEAVPPTLQVGKGALSLSLVRRTFPSGAREPVKLAIFAHGPAVVTIAAGGGGQPASEPRAGEGSLASAARALESGSAVEKSAAIAALARSADPAARDLLARATTQPSEQLATDALMALGGSPAAAAALRKAWSGLDGTRRAALLRSAAELHGAAFAAELQRP